MYIVTFNFRSNNKQSLGLIYGIPPYCFGVSLHLTFDFCSLTWRPVTRVKIMMAEAAKIKRRTAKATLTRLSKTLRVKMEGTRPAEEITGTLQHFKEAWEDLAQKHTVYTELIDSDESFQQEEKWLETCMDDYLLLESTASDYLKLKMEKKKPQLRMTGNESGAPPPDDKGVQANQIESVEDENTHVEEIPIIGKCS